MKANKTPINILTQYFDYNDIFSLEFVVELPEHIDINNYAIEIEESKQPSHSLIYSLAPVELEMLKTYIETNLTNSFIRPSK